MPQPNAPKNPYEFIMAPPEQTKRAPGLAGFGGKLPIILGGILGILILVIILAIVFGGKDKGPTVQLASLSAEQQEIIRVSDLVLDLSRDPATLATASTVKSSIITEQKRAIELLGLQGGQLQKGQINSKLSRKNDENINSAAQSNTLEQAYKEYLKKSLGDYKADLKALYVIGGPNTKTFADNAYKSSDLILNSL